MRKVVRVLSLLVSIFIFEIGCGVKSKPLPPLKEPWISTGDLEKDREKKSKQKRPLPSTENRVEFAPKVNSGNNSERSNEN
ncbi:MAG: hypothetical protein JNL11_12195 [Bdellovibrionaceae bacterium]|nr:hypothetical protein [Pseudobdellovibrionaceae bacterium]